MKLSASPARVAFVVHLEGPHVHDGQSGAAHFARVQHLVHLFRGHHIPATWSVAGCCDLHLIQNKSLLQSDDELALAISAKQANSPLLRDSLRKRVTAIQNNTNTTVGLVSGEPAQLRNHAAFLAEQGLRGILSNMSKRRGENIYSPLPCGLWQFDETLAIPHRSWLARLVSGSALHHLQKLLSTEKITMVSVDAMRLAHTSSRSLQNLEKLLRHVSHAASREEVAITTAGELLAELTASRVARPQHSILRAA